MKSLLHWPAFTGMLLLVLSLSNAPAQNIPNPAAGSPVPQNPAIDPATGLPLSPAVQEEQWIAADFGDPKITLTNVDYNGMPALEVARDLRERFKDYFDILVPQTWTSPVGESVDLTAWPISIQLRNVRASEVFRAMNLFYETQNAPLRWQLAVNGTRPIVLLRVLPDLIPHRMRPIDPTTGLPVGTTPPPAPKQLMVYYVGDLVGNGGMSMVQITDTLADINQKAYGGEISISYHNEAELVIVKGTDDQLKLIHNTLDALKQKMMFEMDQKNQKNAPPTPSGGGIK